MLEGLYLQRREASQAVQRLAAPPEGECAEECLSEQEVPHLADMSKDLLKLAERPEFKVRRDRTNIESSA